MPKFSIIVPVYNVEKYLDECIQSVINQSFTDWELILVDDDSSDSSYETCCEYSKNDSRIIAIHQENGGVSSARNTGIENANGEYVLFLDSDDFYNDLNALEILNNKMTESNADVLIFGCTDFNMNTGESIVSRTGYNLDLINKNDYCSTMHYLLSNKLIPGGSTIFAFKRQIVVDNDIRFKKGIQAEDHDFVLSVFLRAKKISAINEPFYMYRHGRDGSITARPSIKSIKGIEYTVNKWFPILNEINNEKLKRDYLNYIAFIYSTGFVAIGKMDKKQKKEAVNIMKKYRFILKYGYWKKIKLTNVGVRIFGISVFSKLAELYFRKTHIQSVKR